MSVSLKPFAFPMLVVMYVAFAPIGLDLLYNPLIAGDYPSFWPVLYGLVRYAACLIFAGAALLSHGRGSYLKAIMPLAPFLLFALTSVAWSYDPKNTYKQLFYLVCLLIWISAIVSWIDIQKLLRYQGFINCSIIIASVILAVFVPSIGRHHATDLVEPNHAGNWRGMFIHKNILGEFAVSTFVLLLRNAREEPAVLRGIVWLARVSALACLVFSKSSNSIVGLAAGLGAYVMLTYRITANPIFITLMGLFTGALTLGFSLTPAKLAELLGRDPHFTGRTEIWEFGQRMINEHIWLGHGYASADTVFGAQATLLVFGSATSLHNGYLDVLFDGGVAGMVLMMGAVLFIVGRAYLATFAQQGVRRESTIIYIAIIISACAMAFGEGSPFRVVGDGVIGLWIALVALCYVRSEQSRPQPVVLRPRPTEFAMRSLRAGTPT